MQGDDDGAYQFFPFMAIIENGRTIDDCRFFDWRVFCLSSGEKGLFRKKHRRGDFYVAPCTAAYGSRLCIIIFVREKWNVGEVFKRIFRPANCFHVVWS